MGLGVISEDAKTPALPQEITHAALGLMIALRRQRNTFLAACRDDDGVSQKVPVVFEGAGKLPSLADAAVRAVAELEAAMGVSMMDFALQGQMRNQAKE